MTTTKIFQIYKTFLFHSCYGNLQNKPDLLWNLWWNFCLKKKSQIFFTQRLEKKPQQKSFWLPNLRWLTAHSTNNSIDRNLSENRKFLSRLLADLSRWRALMLNQKISFIWNRKILQNHRKRASTWEANKWGYQRAVSDNEISPD